MLRLAIVTALVLGSCIACSPKERTPYGRCYKTFDCPKGTHCRENWCWDLTEAELHFDPRIDDE